MIGSSISLVFNNNNNNNNNNNKLKTYIAHAHDEMIACALHGFNCFNGFWNHYLIWEDVLFENSRNIGTKSLSLGIQGTFNVCHSNLLFSC